MNRPQQMSKSIDTLLEQLSATIALNHEGRKDGYGTVRKEDDMHIEDFKQAIYELLAGEAVWAKVLESTGDCGFIIRTEDAVPLSVLREVFGIKE